MELCKEIMPTFNKYSEEQQKNIIEYLEALDDKEQKVLRIAYEHLGSSFNVVKSNGYKAWVEKKKNKNEI